MLDYLKFTEKAYNKEYGENKLQPSLQKIYCIDVTFAWTYNGPYMSEMIYVMAETPEEAIRLIQEIKDYAEVEYNVVNILSLEDYIRIVAINKNLIL